MSTVDDYIKNGGMAGYARRLLEEQLTQATKDKGHIFHVVVEAMQRGEHKRASELLYDILRALPDGDQLGVVALCFVTLPAIQVAINEAANRIDDSAFRGTLPIEILLWGALEAQARADEPDVQHGKKFKPPEAGSLSSQARYIHNLVRNNRTFSAKQLQKIANPETIGEMGHDAFRDHVTAARKKYPKEKKIPNKTILRD